LAGNADRVGYYCGFEARDLIGYTAIVTGVLELVNSSQGSCYSSSSRRVSYMEYVRSGMVFR